MSDSLSDIVGGLGFRPVSSDELAVMEPRSASLYVLAFADGDAYVGQTRTPRSRIGSHRRRWSDLERVFLRRCPLRDLDRSELETIIELERRSLRLRNIDLVSQPDFNQLRGGVVLTPHDIVRFLDGGALQDGDRIVDADQVLRHRSKFERLRDAYDLEHLCSFLQTFVMTCLPSPRRTERWTWIISCLSLPAGGKGVVSRISVGWQEILTIVAEDGRFRVEMQMRSSVLQEAFGADLDQLFDHWTGLEFDDSPYLAGGNDQIRLFPASLQQARSMLKDRVVIRAVRHLVLTLMMRGTTPFQNSHCYDLADFCLADVESIDHLRSSA